MRRRTAENVMTILNPGTQNINAPIQGSRPVLTESDVAAALAGCTDLQMEIGLYIYAGKESARQIIHQWMLKLIRGWVQDIHQAEAFARICMDDIVPNYRCSTCRGRRKSPDEKGHLQDCVECQGQGKVKPTVKQKAERLGISEKAWYGDWLDRREKIKVRFEAQESIPINQLQKHL